MQREDLFGRIVAIPTLYMTDTIPPDVVILPAIDRGECQRCRSKEIYELPNRVPYCWACSNLGRLSGYDVLLHLPDTTVFAVDRPICIWQGELTTQQKRVSEDQITAFSAGRPHLTYAVTGAGKTEMMFPLLTHVMSLGKRVAFVSPRVDVIVEIQPRLAASFEVPFCTLYGGSKDNYHYTQLVLATTHQLLRFRAAFDLIVVDEVDAFPFAENEQLEQALQAAKKPDGVINYLTATPGERLLKLVRQEEISMSVLPRRFHGYDLPNFTIKRVGDWRKKAPKTLMKILTDFKKSGQRFLLFVPHVDDLKIVSTYFDARIPELQYGITHAKAADRQQVVQAMRDENIQGLITTTILERGVTLPGIDVIILGADDEVFSKSALIQMAGRCGRSARRPDGKVFALVNQKTNALLSAKDEIHRLNRMGNL